MGILGLLSFPLGRLLARVPLRPDRFPFRETAFERETGFYGRLKIRSWKEKAPDVSRMFRGIVPEKKLDFGAAQDAALMIRENCVAELVHWILCFAGIPIVFLWPGPGGAILYIVYVLLGNLPFILIQRYNRPRLVRLQAKQERRRI